VLLRSNEASRLPRFSFLPHTRFLLLLLSFPLLHGNVYIHFNNMLSLLLISAWIALGSVAMVSASKCKAVHDPPATDNYAQQLGPDNNDSEWPTKGQQETWPSGSKSTPSYPRDAWLEVGASSSSVTGHGASLSPAPGGDCYWPISSSASASSTKAYCSRFTDPPEEPDAWIHICG
jgi:hypothetical protein